MLQFPFASALAGRPRWPVLAWGMVLLVLAVALVVLYGRYAAPTRVALVNYPGFQAAKFTGVQDVGWVSVERFAGPDYRELARFDVILVFGRGLTLGEQALADIKTVAASRILYVDAPTNPAHGINSVPSGHREAVSAYIDNAGDLNYQSLLRYFRARVQGRLLGVRQPAPPREIASDVLFHLGPTAIFDDLDSYEGYYRAMPSYSPDAPKIALITTVPGPFNANRDHIDALIRRLEEDHYRVYPLASASRRLSLLRQIEPDLVVLMPHGRLHAGNASEAIAWLKRQNVPVLAPLSVFEPYGDWLENSQGYQGGLLSMNVVLPELDGAVAPFVINAQFDSETEAGVFKAIPGRLERFVELLKGYVGLKLSTNAERKIGIVYFRGPGKNALTAGNLEVARSLYNSLLELRERGYDLAGLPDTYEGFKADLDRQGLVMSPRAPGQVEDFLANAGAAFLPAGQYRGWCQALAENLCQQVESLYGPAPGDYLVSERGIAVARLQYGNVALLPQPLPGYGSNTFALVHGTDKAPPHSYLAAYFWLRHVFAADALVHFGTHGSLEFTPSKQVALSDADWSDALIGGIPHFYFYTMSNVGEAIIAKRRSYATIVNHLTPPFRRAGLDGNLIGLQRELATYAGTEGAVREESRLAVNRQVSALGLDRDLKLESGVLDDPAGWNERVKLPLTQWLESVAAEKITQGLYTLGDPYTEADASRTSALMFQDTLAAHFDQVLELAAIEPGEPMDAEHWLLRASQGAEADQLIGEVFPRLYPSVQAWREAGRSSDSGNSPRQAMAGDESRHPAATNHYGALSKHLDEIKAVLDAASRSAGYLLRSGEHEFAALANALSGGYVAPAAGGDPLLNPDALPTGRNMFSIDAEKTPGESAWTVGVAMARELIESHRKSTGKMPRKVAFTLWPSSFIHSQGATIAEILYLLGVEPVRDPFGRIQSLRLIPETELGRPRVDVVVQSAGQLRDLAASRLALIEEAVGMAADAGDVGDNYVRDGVRAAEKYLLEQGQSPLAARRLAARRSFGGVNNTYGTGIMGLVEESERWDNRGEIAGQYLQNMGAVYGESATWGEFNPSLYAAALLDTDIIVQPRSSNTWGALSLDHVYEFMGGLSAAVSQVTGGTPAAYFNDFRNSAQARLTNLEQTIWLEARTSLLNPAYITGLSDDGGASSAEVFAESFRNTFGWSSMRPEAIDNALWEQLYEVYAKDSLQLGLEAFFRKQNPYALQEMTGVMLEASRKGFWEATPQQRRVLATMHAELVGDYDPGCGAFTCGNPRLREFIEGLLDDSQRRAYAAALDHAENAAETDGAIVLVEQSQAGQARSVEGNDGPRKARESRERDTSAEPPVVLSGRMFGALVGMLVLVAALVWLRARRRG